MGDVCPERNRYEVWVLSAPGVYRPQEDTRLLAEAVATAAVPAGARVLDVCTGTGAVAIAAARAGAGTVTALDVSRRALLVTWLNGRLRGLPLRVRRGDLRNGVAGGPFDVVLANPPYVPYPGAGDGPAARWDAGRDGRSVLGPLCAAAPALLAERGFLLLVQSAISGVDPTLDRLREAGLKTSVVARARQPFGPVLRRRAAYLEDRGLIEPGRRDEELVVIRADRTEPGS
ncbi:release factor glutamine methyltransferase [Prauserella shujinwangii]|uniref:Release factor glutamine methyltransferase n=1 Tax=Prauserella shujinwangii TaxID=1453103 RepID=A0A2T0LX67_9PSEU|nr:release factor glutamine methyltransferase [Prauserella shujinwangii]